MDNILLLESDIRNAFLKRKHVVAVFFDLEKAYDRASRIGILCDLKEMNMSGNLPKFIANFLSNRIFQVKLGNTLSDTFIQEEGVPQGSVLSVTLFSIKINNILKQLSPAVRGSLYVDDFAIWCQGREMRFIERQLQNSIKHIEKWCNNNGFAFSNNKTNCIHFCRKRGLHPEPELTLNGNSIPVTDQLKFLGIILDKKLSFKAHIQYLKNKCSNKLNILKVLSNTFWGADRASMLSIYKALIRSHLDYGSVVYGAAKPSTLKKLDSIHNQALRLCSGAFRTSPIQSLYVYCNEPSLNMRRTKQAIKYYFHLKSLNLDPYSNSILSDQNNFLYQARSTSVPPFGMRVRRLMEEWNMEDVPVTSAQYFDIPPWHQFCFSFINPFEGFQKNEFSDSVFKQLYYNFTSKFKNYNFIYTDGSKIDHTGYVGYAVVYGEQIKSFRLHEAHSIYSAELLAIYNALLLIQHHKLEKSIMFTDSLSSFQTLSALNFHSHPFISKILKLNNFLSCKGHNVMYTWVPSHVGIKGNEIADRAAKSAINMGNDQVPVNDVKSYSHSIMFKTWQLKWNDEINNKLRAIKSKLGVWEDRHNRRESVILTRLRIGHSRLTHQHLLKGESEPKCRTCDVSLSVHHILISCPVFNQLRSSLFTNDFNLSTLIGISPHPNLFQFLHLIGVHNLL